MALAMDVLDGGFWHFDIASGEVEVTPKLAALVTGHAAERMSWAAFTAHVHRDDGEVRDLGPLIRGEIDAATVEYRIDDPRGGRRWFRSRRRLLRGQTGAPERVMGAVLDITEQRRLRLGGRPNVDLNGHATGDLVLRELAARLRRIVRPDDVVARLGGDEFAILVADVEGGALPYLAQRLVLAARQPVATPMGELSIGISIGVARSVAGDGALSDLAARAARAGATSWRHAAS